MDYTKVSTLFNGEDISLAVNSTNSKWISILQMQCQGDISFNINTGIGLAADQDEKHKSFLLLANEKAVDLVLTPEGSISNRLIKSIIQDSSLWPKLGALWCLSAQGCSWTNFNENLDEISSLHNIKLIVEKNNITVYKHVNAIWFLFKRNENELAVIVQLKTTHMRDISFELEAGNLSLGQTIYIFDLNGNEQSNNLFLSLICADFIDGHISELISNLANSSVLIFNPQLNPNPKSDIFGSARITLFTDCSIEQRLITLNWANGTSLGPKSVIYPGSAYYNKPKHIGARDLQAVCSDQKLFQTRKDLHSEGVAYSYATPAYCNMWNLPTYEHVIFYRIKKKHYRTNDVLTAFHDPCDVDLFEYKENWIRKNLELCSKGCLDKIEDSKITISYPQKCKNECNKCDIIYNDFFFSLCFGASMKDELSAKDEKGQRTIAIYDQDAQERQEDNIYLFNYLSMLINNNVFPQDLAYLEDSCKYYIDNNCAKCGSDQIYNLVYIENEIKDSDTGKEIEEKKEKNYMYKGKNAIVAILNSDREKTASDCYKKFYEITNDKYKNQIVIYYRDILQGGFKMYNGPYNQLSIKNPDFTKEPVSIKGAK